MALTACSASASHHCHHSATQLLASKCACAQAKSDNKQPQPQFTCHPCAASVQVFSSTTTIQHHSHVPTTTSTSAPTTAPAQPPCPPPAHTSATPVQAPTQACRQQPRRQSPSAAAAAQLPAALQNGQSPQQGTQSCQGAGGTAHSPQALQEAGVQPAARAHDSRMAAGAQRALFVCHCLKHTCSWLLLIQRWLWSVECQHAKPVLDDVHCLSGN